MDKIRLATVWLTGCSGCHMSFLDLDEWLIELARWVEMVYSPIGSDCKDYPENVDICLVEGAIGNEENLELIRWVRQQTKIVISLGDCAVTGNVPALRNLQGGAVEILQRAYQELADLSRKIPEEPGIIPKLLERVIPVHEAIEVDIFMPGCPPSAGRIKAILEPLLKGELPEMLGREMLKFG